MKRLLGVAAAVAVAVVVARRMARAARTYPPSSLVGAGRDSAMSLLGTVKDFVTDVREGMAEREAEIHAAFAEGVALDDDLHLPPSDGEPSHTVAPGAAPPGAAPSGEDGHHEHNTGATHR